jgi:cobaltochelatase CobS
VQLAAGLNAPMSIFSGRRDAEPSEVMGKTHLVNGSTKFVRGPVIDIYEKGGVILFDEIEANSPETILAMHRLLERKPLFLEDGSVVYPAQRVLIIATGNTRGDGDGSECDTGTSVVNKASLNRFEKWTLPYPEPPVLENILSTHLANMDSGAIKAMVKVSVDVNTAYMQGSCPDALSIRDLIRWGKKLTLSAARTDISPVYHSFDKAFGNGVDCYVRTMLHKFVQTHFNVPAPLPPHI